MNNNEKVLIKGNYAIAQAAVNAGLQCYFGYPITPQTEIGEYLSSKMPELGRGFVCAESEIAAINMVYGVAATGKRVMTSSSSPGISLKGEGLSYLHQSLKLERHKNCDIPYHCREGKGFHHEDRKLRIHPCEDT